MEKQTNPFTQTCARSVYLGVCLWLFISEVYGQKNLGQLNTDGYQYKIHYVDTIYQDAVVPDNASGSYLFLSAIGADGGYKRRRSNTNKDKKNVKGGKGALVQAWFKIGNRTNEIPPGATIRFIIGQKGHKVSNAGDGGSGGGGGTGIAYMDPRSGKWRLLLVAGGGGGGVGDCCITGKEGGSGRPYRTGQQLAGYHDYKNHGDSQKKRHLGGSAFGAPNYESYEDYQKEGWLKGLKKDENGWRVGEPTGVGFSVSGKKTFTRGSWGFGAGGAGERHEFWGGGGGGYVGGKTDYQKEAEGGESFVNEEEMKVSGIFSRNRGKTDNPQNGSVTYRLIDQPSEILLSAKPGKCVNVNGTNINVSDCRGRDNQQWFFLNNTIISKLNTSKCLDLDRNKNDNGTNIQLYDCNGSNAQRWVYDGLSKQVRYLQNWKKCLDLESVNNGNIRLWDCQDEPNQQWKIDGAIPMNIGTQGNNRVKTVYLAKDDGKCINLDGANTNNKTSNIHLYDCTGYGAQKWLFDGINIRYYGQQNKCVDLAYNKTNNGTNIRLWDCNGSDAQHWVYDGVSSTIRYWKNPDKCLGVKGGSMARGTNIEIRDCDGSAGQRWKIKDANTPFGPDKVMSIKRFIDDKKCLDVDGGRTTNGTNIQLGNCTNNTDQQWTYDGLYLRYKKDPSKCLDLKAANTHRGNNIQLYTCNSTKAQRWLYDQKEHKIRYADNWNRCLEVYKDINKTGTNIQIYDCRDTDAQRWIMK